MRASTHAIAQGAGVRQATLYHHFSGREALLLALLLETVQPTLEVARELTASSAPAPARLWALAWWDARQLGHGPVNQGALYLLPETQQPEFAEFREAWEDVRSAYAELIEACGVADPAVTDLVLGLVESVILIRQRQGLETPIDPGRIADAAVTVILGRTPSPEEKRQASALASELPDLP